MVTIRKSFEPYGPPATAPTPWAPVCVGGVWTVQRLDPRGRRCTVVLTSQTQDPERRCQALAEALNRVYGA